MSKGLHVKTGGIELFDAFAALQPPGWDEGDLLCAAVMEGLRTLMLVYKDDEIAGYGQLNWKPKYAFYGRFDIPEIQNLNVLPDHRRIGCARAMITAAENMAVAAGKTDIGISFPLDPRFGAAQRLYTRLGYHPDGLGPSYDRRTLANGENVSIDENFCLMLVKELPSG